MYVCTYVHYTCTWYSGVVGVSTGHCTVPQTIDVSSKATPSDFHEMISCKTSVLTAGLGSSVMTTPSGKAVTKDNSLAMIPCTYVHT